MRITCRELMCHVLCTSGWQKRKKIDRNEKPIKNLHKTIYSGSVAPWQKRKTLRLPQNPSKPFGKPRMAGAPGSIRQTAQRTVSLTWSLSTFTSSVKQLDGSSAALLLGYRPPSSRRPMGVAPGATKRTSGSSTCEAHRSATIFPSSVALISSAKPPLGPWASGAP